MAQEGLGVLIARMVGWGHTADQATIDAIIGATIESLDVDGSELTIVFENGYKLVILDNGQSCCEHRYMNTDDDLGYHIGAELVDIRVEDGPEVENEYEYKECAFLIVDTTKGSFTVANYNEHNGYYGGFAIQTRVYAPTEH